MATTLPRPYVLPISAYDYRYSYDITFMYTGNQSVKNRLVITNALTGEVVYDITKETMKLSHTVPEKTLTSPMAYFAQIQVFDIDGNSSILSDEEYFICSEAPTCKLQCMNNPPSYEMPQIYRNASISVLLDYTTSFFRPEGTYAEYPVEPISSYTYHLYDSQRIEIDTSETFYNQEYERVPTLQPYSFSGLENNTVYYVRCTGLSVHSQFVVDTGYIEVDVQYNVIPANILFTIENHYHEGTISVQTNIKDVGYHLENDNYSLQDGCLILDDNSITYDEGFSVDSDFVLYVEAKLLPLGTFLKTESGSITLSLKNICDRIYCEFKTDNEYVIYCDLPKAQLITQDGYYITTRDGRRLQTVNMDATMDNFVVFELKRINNIYALKAYYRSDYTE